MENGDLFACGRGFDLVPKIINTNIKDVAVGINHYILLTDKQRVIVNGMGHIDFKDSGIEIIASGTNHGVVVSVDGKGYTFGNNSCGQCGYDSNGRYRIPHELPLTDERIIAVSCSDTNNLLLTKKNNVYSFGLHRACNELLGLGNSTFHSPHLMHRKKELGLKKNDYIIAVFALSADSIIIVDPCKKY